jgi:hypothetical protein
MPSGLMLRTYISPQISDDSHTIDESVHCDVLSARKWTHGGRFVLQSAGGLEASVAGVRARGWHERGVPLLTASKPRFRGIVDLGPWA